MNQLDLIILGAGGPKYGREHQAGLQKVTSEGKSVLAWLLHAVSGYVRNVDFVGGYEIDKVMRHFPDLTYHYNDNWQATGSAVSLGLALDASQLESDVLICYDDIIFRESVVGNLIRDESDKLSIAVNCREGSSVDDAREPEVIWLNNGQYAGEFTGLVYVPRKLLAEFKEFVADACKLDPRVYLSSILSAWIVKKGRDDVRLVDVNSDWAHIESGKSIAEFILGSKAKTLSRLSGRVEKSNILPLVYFERNDWLNASGTCVEKVFNELSSVALVVRSSAQNEDGFDEVNAGKFVSLLNVEPSAASLYSAVEEVFSSYSSLDPKDEVLIQPMLSDVVASGVVFTRTLGSGAPYYVVNYAEGSDTTVITSGVDASDKVWTIFKPTASNCLENAPECVRTVVEAAIEIENLVDFDALDIEFAQDSLGNLYTLQVRPVYLNSAFRDRSDDSLLADALLSVESYLDNDFLPPGLDGDLPVWSVMSDWNPAEIVGVKPFPLSFDLYRHIITDHTWSQQRFEIGCRDLRGYPLIRSFAGQTFVDVRASINSFIPADLSPVVAARVVNYALSKLRMNPELHDKVEFSLLPTCLDFNFNSWNEEYHENSILDSAQVGEYKKSVLAVTNNVIARVKFDYSAAEALDAELLELDTVLQPKADMLRYYLSVCRDKGTLPFAHLARAGFVAASILKSLVDTGLLTEVRKSELLASIKTVSSRVSNDAWLVKTGQISFEEFVASYGHLRPGTYDISSPTYASSPEIYLRPLVEAARNHIYKPFEWSCEEREAVSSALIELGFEFDADGLYDFLFSAISGREYSKFVFTKLLSKAIDLSSNMLSDLGIPDCAKSYTSLNDLLDLGINVFGEGFSSEVLLKHAQEREGFYSVASQIKMPPVLFSAADLYCFKVPESDPNFVTLEGCSGELICLDEHPDQTRMLAGKVVAIPNADPGYDFLFSLGIKALITAYGGPNSHMAIRAAEFNLPAVIGIGAKQFSEMKTGMNVDIDCKKSYLKLY